MTKNKTTLHDAIQQDAYEWLSHHSPTYIDAIENELAAGATPESIRLVMLRSVGPERTGLALRCYQAALYLSGRAA